jgi:hypothetical protein
VDGEVPSIDLIFFPLSERDQSSFHILVSPSLYALFAVDGFMNSGFLRSGGRSLASEVVLFAAMLKGYWNV